MYHTVKNLISNWQKTPNIGMYNVSAFVVNFKDIIVGCFALDRSSSIR